MNNRYEHAAASVLLVVVALTGPGCTLLFGIAGGTAKGKVMATDISAFPEGTNVILTMESGEKVSGKYAGTENRLDADYYSRYEATASVIARSDGAPGFRLPEPGEDLTLRMYPDSVNTDITFLGFGGYGWTYMIAQVSSGEERQIPLARMSQITGPSGINSPVTPYLRLAGQRAIPRCTHLLIEGLDGVRSVEADDVLIVRKSGGSAGGGLAMLVGLSLDLVIYRALTDGKSFF